MNRIVITAMLTLLATPVLAVDTPKTEEEKTLYVIGQIVSRQLSAFSLTPAELEVVKLGITDGVTGSSAKVDPVAYDEKVQQLARTRIKAQAESMAPLNKDFLDKAAKEKDAVKTASGLIYFALNEGSGSPPGPVDMVKVNYRGTLADGKEFDSSYKRGKPLEIKLDNVISCWKEGLQKMKPGGKARLVCPPSLAYGDTGVSSIILPGSTLAFEVELLEVRKQP